MKYLHNKFVENFLFEQKFLNVIRNPGAGPAAKAEGPKTGPKPTVTPDAKLTIEDVKTRTKHIRENIGKVKQFKNSKKRKVLKKHMDRIEKKMKRLDDSLGSKADKQAVIDETYQHLGHVMILHGLMQPKSVSGHEVLLSNTPASQADIADHTITVLDAYLDNSIKENIKTLKWTPSKTRATPKYKEISKALKTAREGMKDIDKDKVSVPSKLEDAVDDVRDQIEKAKKKQPQNKKEIDALIVKHDKAVQAKDTYVFKEKEKEYKKVNIILQTVVAKYKIKLTPYRGPTISDVTSLIAKLTGSISKVKPASRQAELRKALKVKGERLDRITNTKLIPSEKKRLIKKEHDSIKALFVDYGLEKVSGALPIERRIDGKIKILEKYLEMRKGIAPHFMAMMKSKYNKGYRNIQKTKRVYEKALKEKNPIIRKFMLMQIDKKLDDAFKSQMKKEKSSDSKDKRLWLPENLKHEQAQVFEHLGNLPDDKAVDHVLSYLEGLQVLLKPHMKKINSDPAAKKIVNDLVKGVKESRKRYEALIKEKNPDKKKKGFIELKAKITKIVRNATLPVKIPKLSLASLKANEALKNLPPEKVVDHKMKHIRKVHKQYLKVLKNKKYPNKKAREKDNAQKVQLAMVVSSFETKYKAAKAVENPKEREKKFKKLNDDINKMVVLINAKAKGKFEIKFPPLKGQSVSPKNGAAAKPSGPKQYPKKPKSKEAVTGGRKKLMDKLKAIESGNVGNYQYALESISLILQKMGNGYPPKGPLDKVVPKDLPGGFKLATINWPNVKQKNGKVISNQTMVNLVIYNSEGRIICVREGAAWLNPDKNPHIRKTAEVVKSHAIMSNIPKTLKRIQVGDKPSENDKVRFGFQEDLAQFKNALLSLGKNMTLNPPPVKPRLVINNANMRVTYRATGGGHGEFEIKLNKPKFTTLYFDTQTGKLGIAKIKSVNGKPEVESKYGSEMDAMTKTEKARFDKVKQSNEDAKKAKKDRARTEGMIGDKFRKAKGFYKFQSATDGNQFTITGTATTHPKLMKNKIHKLLNLNKVKRQFVRITITGKDKKVRHGLYVPGQKTAYLSDGKGKILRGRKRLTWGTGDKIRVKPYDPSAKEVKALGSIGRKFEELRKRPTIGLLKNKVNQIYKQVEDKRKAHFLKPSKSDALKTPKYALAMKQIKAARKAITGIEAEKNPRKKQRKIVALNKKIDAQVAKTKGEIKLKPYTGNE